MAGAAGDSKGAAPSDEPHSPQNLLSGAFVPPQLGHVKASAEPHSLQNFRPASFEVPQFEHAVTAQLSQPTQSTPPGAAERKQ